MSRFKVYLTRLIVGVITIVLINKLLIVTVDTFRNEYKENTSVGNIYLGGVLKKDVSEYIEPKFNDFLDELELKYSYNNNTYIEKAEFVDYHHEETLSNIKNDSKSDVILSINSNKLKLLLSRNLPRNIYNSLDYDALITDLQSNYVALAPKAEIYILDYILDIDLLIEEIDTYFYYVDDVDDLVTSLIDVNITVEPNSRFSVLNTFSETNLSTEELNILATGINAIVLETNFTSFVKSSSRIPYTMVNQDIEIYETAVNKTQNKDFSFYNPYDLSYEIKVRKVSGGLRFSLVGIPFDVTYGFLTEESNVPYVSLDEDIVIPLGAKLINGIDGKEIKVYRYNFENGRIANKELIYINYFGPRNETYRVEG